MNHFITHCNRTINADFIETHNYSIEQMYSLTVIETAETAETRECGRHFGLEIFYIK